MGYENLEELIEVIRRLRAPDGCKWDREQTHYSLRPNMLEEAYEAVDAIDDNDMVHLKEELGDVLLQVVLHAQIASEENEFNIDDVAKGIKDKLIRRHPHVFGTTKVSSTAEILDNWDKLKNIFSFRVGKSFLHPRWYSCTPALPPSRSMTYR